jgi:uncharacterized protein YdeI (YjbR/CyaY-like superfamily)
VRFFATPAEWRSWLEEHHATETELVVGFWKRSTGKPCMTWSESVDEALCFGWIDAIRRRVDDESYTIRFTRRKPTSIWSAVNVAKMGELEKQGKVREAGALAFARRSRARTAVYSFEQGEVDFDDSALRANDAAWVVSAKREQTRASRLAQLVADCAAGVKIKSQRY